MPLRLTWAGRPIDEVAREYGLDPANIVKLASNENPLGMPAAARDAIQRSLGEVGRYPDANGHALKQAIMHKHGVPNDWITLGNGSNDILVLAAQAFLSPGTSAVYSAYSFLVYALATQEVGARAIVAPADASFGHDVAAISAAIDADTRLVYIANPNNPTGSFIRPQEIEAFLLRTSPQVVVVLDEAYTDYLPPELRFDSVQWVRRFPNLIVTRTLSKAYGLAGLRVGLCLGAG